MYSPRSQKLLRDPKLLQIPSMEAAFFGCLIVQLLFFFISFFICLLWFACCICFFVIFLFVVCSFVAYVSFLILSFLTFP